MLSSSQLGVSELVGERYVNSIPALRFLIVESFKRGSNLKSGDVNQKLDVGFTALKNINTVETILKENYSRHSRNSTDEVYNKAVHKVGSVVRHTLRGYRGIVCGWELKEDCGAQMVSILVDSFDAQQTSSFLPPKTEVQADLLQPVTDPSLCHIHHSSLSDHFLEYCCLTQCYLPNSVLKFSYPRDSPTPSPPAPEMMRSSSRLCEWVGARGRGLQRQLADTRLDPVAEVLSELHEHLHLMAKYSSVSMGEKGEQENSWDWRRGYEAVGTLSDVFALVDQMLQLRFQRHGISYFETMSADSSDSTGQPEACFRVGDVVSHKKFGYRGVVVGWDQRPLFDVRDWTGVLGLPSAQEQPFYRVIPDEADVERVLGEGQYRPHFYVAQENLETVLPGTTFSVRHRLLPQYFSHYEEHMGYPSSSRLSVPPLLDFCFPSPSSSSSFSSTCTATSEEDPKEAAFAVLESILCDMYKSLRRELSHATMKISTERDDRCLRGEDLHTLLRHARRQDYAMIVERVIWMTWMSHDNSEVSKIMRIGTAHMKRGNTEDAIRCYSLAAQRDPSYAEPLNKLAALHLQIGNLKDSVDYSESALSKLPVHVGALSTQGFALSKLDRTDEAIVAYRKVLNIHPWASRVSSELSALVFENDNNTKEA